jgi:ankyrin repeat protein
LVLQSRIDLNAQDSAGDTALFDAIRQDHIDIALVLVEVGADLNVFTRGEVAVTALCAAIGKGFVDLSMTLIDKGADVNVSIHASDGKSSHIIYIAFARMETFPELRRICAHMIRKGALVGINAEQAVRFLAKASRNGDSDIVEAILQTTKVDVNVLVDGATPLYWASQEGHADIVEILIEYKADLHIRYKSNTCLIVASQSGRLRAVCTILSEVRFRGDKTYLSAQNEEGGTCLHAACQAGHTAIVRALLDSPDLRASESQITPLHLACHNSHLAIVEAWGRAELDLDALDANLDTALTLSCHVGHWRIAEHLVDIGASMNVVSSQGGEAHLHDGPSILHIASAAGQRDLVKAILGRPEDVPLEARDADGLTALDHAWSKDTDIALMLIEGGASPYLHGAPGARGTTVWHSACMKNNLPLIESLMLAPVALDLQDNEGAMALHRSCELGKLEVAKAFVEGKADVNAVDFKGATPLIYAFRA